MSLLGYATLTVYNYLYHHADAKNAWTNLAMPVLFSLAGVALILLFFNWFDPTSI